MQLFGRSLNLLKKHIAHAQRIFSKLGSGYHYSLFLPSKGGGQKGVQTRRSIPNAKQVSA